MDVVVDELSSYLSTLTTAPCELPVLDKHKPTASFPLPSLSTCPMATNSHHLLVYHHQMMILFELPSFKILFSTSINPLIETPISDICFSSTFDCFLLSSSNSIYSYSPLNGQIEPIHRFSNSIWSITYTSTHLYVCFLFGFTIEQWELNAGGGLLTNSWPREKLIDSLDLGINCIRATKQFIGMTIKQSDFSWRIDVFDACTMVRVRRGLTIEQDNGLSNWTGLLTPLDDHRWLLADGDQGLFMIDEDNQKKVTKLACNVCLVIGSGTDKHSWMVVQSHETLDLYDIQ